MAPDAGSSAGPVLAPRRPFWSGRSVDHATSTPRVPERHRDHAEAGSGPLRVSELAEWQGVDKSTMTMQVRRLEERGLVERRPDPRDRRGVLVRATPRGRRVRSRMDAAGAAVFTDMLRDWPAADRAALTDLLERFARELGERALGDAPATDDPAP
ncbi:MarR family winged helix-turn-helix transcriptional regulator [Pseudonocardia humida]|uniref:Winged helix-turn-helix transcriptional regulator n=1 Tax=Pseudonocardia humida TaxID=2800819 RepID=A0ABT0ZV63_9PSEU|nr:MarR family winged helix-turn-helix transcriptional regulator [Pseudonocardia humida]MCO1654631.1 winged helix-turn-helix transcriptional regulator [Pseudonocardia humida]